MFELNFSFFYVFEIFNYIGFDNGVCEFGLLFCFLKISFSDIFFICVVVL